jgi:hypothetical protein
MRLIGRDTDVFGKGSVSAGPRDTPPHKVNATVIIPLLAIKTAPTIQRRLYHHLLSRPPRRDIWAHAGNLPAELMPHNEAGRPRVRAVVKAIQVTTTDPRALHLDEHLICLRFGVRDMRQSDVSRTVKDGC